MTRLSEYFVKMADILPSITDVETTLFEEGFSNKVYLIHWGGVSRYVLRIPYIDSEAFYINRSEEMHVLKSAAAIGLSPKVVWSDDDGGFACEFVHQPSLDWTVVHQNNEVERIAAALKKTHQLPKGDHEYSIFKVITHYLDGISAYGKGYVEFEREYDYLLSLFKKLTPPKEIIPPVLCHNDLNPKNTLIDSERLWLIDWEYSGVGDPLFDLAVVVKSHNLDTRQTRLLLNTYSPDLPEQASLNAIQEYVKAYGLREMAWLLLKHVITPEDTLSLSYYYEFKATPTLNPFA